jgi:membrane peptidoglycan carboxypeptidase
MSEVALTMVSMMRGVAERYCPLRYLSRAVGWLRHSQRHTDVWFGYTPTYVTGVWMGYQSGRSRSGMT